MNALNLTIPAPCAWINANERLHWAEKARRTRIWRYTARGAVLAQAKGATFDVPVQITVTVHKARAGRWDATNLAPTGKALIDGLVDAGVIPDDSNEYVVGPDMRAGEKRDAACVVVTVRAINQPTKETR